MRRLKSWERKLRKAYLEEACEEMAEESAGILVMLRKELAGELSRDTGHIDHSPGGSPSPYPPAAPAPDHTYRTPERFHRTPRTPSDRVSFHDLIGRANRASRQAMRGKQWGDADRQDAASHAVESVIRKATEREGSRPDIPAELASGVALYRLAKDWRESKSASADRDNAESIRRAFSEAVHPDPGQQLQNGRDVCRTIHAALTSAWEALEALGLPNSGPCFTVAYTAARMTVLDSYADVAAELGMSRAAHKKVISRAPLSIPAASDEYRPNVRSRTTTPTVTRKKSRGGYWAGTWKKDRAGMDPTRAAFLEALYSLDRADAGATRTTSAGLQSDWREAPKAEARVTRTRTRRYFYRTPADWTRDLSPRARQALHAASWARQERANVPTENRCKA